MWSGRRVLVTGGAGVIGTALVARLHAAGAELLVGDLEPRPEGWPAAVRFRQGDLNALTAAELDAFAPQVVFHLAATFERSVETYGFWEENERHNVRLSAHLAGLLKDRPEVEQVVFASSYLAYDPALYLLDGPTAEPVALHEDAPLRPRNICGAAKLLHEAEVAFLAEFGRFAAVSARIFRVYGRGSRDVVSRWVRAALAGEPIELFGADGRFDYVLADDVAEALARLAEVRASGVVNVATGRSRRVGEVVDVLRGLVPGLQVVEGDGPPGPLEASQADVSRLHELTGWSPGHALEDGVPLLLEHERRVAAGPSAVPPERRRPGVLVTSVSRKAPLVRVVRAALEDLGRGGRVVGADTDPLAPAAAACDDLWVMPRGDALRVEDVVAACERHDLGLVVPTRDGELAWWAAHRDALAAAGVHVLVAPPDAVAACLDKLVFAERLHAAGLPAIPTAAAPDPAWTRLVVRERHGAGARGLALDVDAAVAHAHAAGLAAPVFSPFVEGREHSIDLFAARDGEVLGVVARTRDVVAAGESQVTTTVRHPALEALARDVVALLGLEGHVVLQVLVDDAGAPHVVEANARFGGASTLGVAAGLQSFTWALLEARGARAADRPFHRVAGERRLVRLPADEVVPA